MKHSAHEKIAGPIRLCTTVLAVLCFCACVVACGGTDDNTSGSAGDGTWAATGKNRENKSSAKEHVYRFREVVMPDLGGDEISICASACRDRTVFMLVKVTDWKNYNDNDIRVLRFQEDSSRADVFPLETIPWSFGQRSPDAWSPGPLSSGAESDAGPRETSFYESYTCGADGNFYAVRTCTRDNAQSDATKNGDTTRFLCCWAADGKQLWESPIEAVPTDDGPAAVCAISVTADGSVSLILTTDSHAWQISASADAPENLSAPGRLSDEVYQAFAGSSTIICGPDGHLIPIRYGTEGWETQSYSLYDPDTGTLDGAGSLPRSHGWDGYGAIIWDGHGLLYSGSTGVCACIPGDAEGTERMNYINSDLNVRSFDALASLDDTSFAGMFYESGLAKLGVFTYADPADLPDRTVLTLSGVSVSDEVLQRVVEFNRCSGKYRIIVQDPEACLSGNLPDILVADGLPVDTYAADGLLADIGELLQRDCELSGTDFLQNIFDACSVKGRLYCLIPSFRICTMIGASSVVGDRTSWTFSQAAQLLETLPEGTSLFPATDRSSFWDTWLTYAGGGLIDAVSGQCGFRSQDFFAILEYAKSLPETLDAASYGESYWRNYEAQFKEGRTVLAYMSLSSFSDAPYYVNGLFETDISYIGFPAENGAGSYIEAAESYAISSRCESVQGAWEFLRYYLTDEYQSQLETGLPVQKKYFLENSGTALENTATSDAASASGTPAPLTEKQLEKLIGFICSTNRRPYADEDIRNIIEEETGAFFSGDKTAQEAAEIIQNRAQLRLDEIIN